MQKIGAKYRNPSHKYRNPGWSFGAFLPYMVIDALHIYFTDDDDVNREYTG